MTLPSDDEMPIGQISRLIGSSGTSVTALAHRKQIRPVVEDRMAMNRILRTDAPWSLR